MAKNHKRAICTECFDITHAKCTRFLNLKAVSSTVPASWICLKCTSNFIIPDLDESEQYDTSVSSNTPNNTNIRSILDQHPKHLKIMHLNTQSMVSTFNEFLLVVSQYSFDVPYLLEYVSITGHTALFRNRDVIKDQTSNIFGSSFREEIDIAKFSLVYFTAQLVSLTLKTGLTVSSLYSFT